MLRILLVTHEHLLESDRRSSPNFVGHLANLADVRPVVWDDLERLDIRTAAAAAGGSIDDFDACLFFVRMRVLLDHDGFDWNGFDGPRAWLEFDAVQNYWPCEIPLRGTFPGLYRRQGFDLMLSTGRRTAEMLRADGVNARWLPKGYSHDHISDLCRERSGICTFGRKWPSRRALVHHLDRNGVRVEDVSGPFVELNDRLNRHLAGVVCNMPSEVPHGRLGQLVNRVAGRPLLVRVWPAIEPMIKTFEMAGAGCALVVDHVDELDELGFVDGENCLVYRSFDEAVDILRSTDDETLRQVGKAGAELVRSRHTWRDRAARAIELMADPDR